MSKPLNEIGPLYVVMHDGCGDAYASHDSGNPFHTLEGAREARASLGAIRAKNYYIVKFKAEKVVFGRARRSSR